MSSLVTWVAESSAHLVCGLGIAVEAGAASPKFSFALLGIHSDHLGGRVVDSSKRGLGPGVCELLRFVRRSGDSNRAVGCHA